MAKIECIKVGGSYYNVGELTPHTLGELVQELATVGDDVQAVMMKGKYKSVTRVK